MESTCLLFDRTYAFLGEMTTRDGVLGRFMLTVEGERQLSAYVKDWQTRGVPVLREVSQTKETSSSAGHVFFQERILPRETEFEHAACHFMEARGMAVVSLSQPALECWERIVRLPLEPRERFSMVIALRGAPAEDLGGWQKALSEALAAAEDERAAMKKAIADLWDRTAQELVKKFNPKKAAV